jgi:hypothetical protein
MRFHSKTQVRRRRLKLRRPKGGRQFGTSTEAWTGGASSTSSSAYLVFMKSS